MLELIEFTENYDILMLQYDLPGLGRIKDNNQLYLIMPLYSGETVDMYDMASSIKTQNRMIFSLPNKYINTDVDDRSASGQGLISGGVDSENLLIMVQDSTSYLWGWIDYDGKEVIQCNYEFASHFGLKKLSMVKREQKIGIINIEGACIVPIEYLEVDFIDCTDRYYLCKRTNGKCVIYDSVANNEIDIPFKILVDSNFYHKFVYKDYASVINECICFESLYYVNPPKYQLFEGDWVYCENWESEYKED